MYYSFIKKKKKACSSVVLELMFPKHEVEGSSPFKPKKIILN